MEIKQHATEQEMGPKKKQKSNQNIPKMNEIRKTKYQNLWNAAKAVLRETFIGLTAYLKEQ